MSTWREDLAWAAGLFEGEGSWSPIRRDSGNPRLTAQLGMTDLDTVDRFEAIAGRGVRSIIKANRAKPLYHWRIAGYEHVQALAAMLWPWLSQRRRGRVVELLRNTQESPIQRFSWRTRCPRGHPYDGRTRHGYRICLTCRRQMQSEARDRKRAKA